MKSLLQTRVTLASAMIVVGAMGALPKSLRSGLVVHAAAVQTAASQVADAPRVENAKFEKRAVTTSLAAALRDLTSTADQPQWIGYAVDQISSEHSMCCWDSGNLRGDAACGACKLEKASQSVGTTTGKDGAAIRLEGSPRMTVLFRLENKRLTKLRVFSADCTLDAGGLPFLWLIGVQPAESVTLLSTYVPAAGNAGESEDDSISYSALMAIAMHADASAGRAMESFIAPGQPDLLRKHASFWLGAARGKSGLTLLENMARSDPSPEVRSQVAFAFSVSKEPAALDDMIRMAHDDASAHVRGQALFWLAQKAGQKAAGTIQGAIENDPDTEVKMKAVFALSEMPKDEGVPKLIEVAQTNRNPKVRRQAMFWLGESHDPRALAFFEKILSR